jgi:chemosensory pili system protein ChpC
MAPIQPFDIKPNTPDWFLGFFPWRNTRVPVISYESINRKSSPKLSARGRVAVLNNTGVSDDVPFVGVLTQDIPRMTRVEESDILENTDTEKGEYDLMVVKVGMEELAIPNIEALEFAICQLDLARF